MCAGKNDDELFGFVSNVALCLLGNDGYDSLCKTTAEAGEENICPDLKTVLDEIRLWQNKGLIVKNWYDSNGQDITDFFVPERNAGTIFMSLSLHRKIQSMYLKYFETLPFPRKDAAFSSGIVAPEISALSISNADIAETIIRQLLSEEVQAQLSDRTKLAPCTRNAVAHDRQSDDVRYWAASSNKGALVQIGLASFSDPVQRKTFAKTIRSYLRQ